LASCLAVIAGAPVPYVEISEVEGAGLFAISYVHSVASEVLASKEKLTRVYSVAERKALKLASGLLPFLAWVSADDHHGDDTNLVRDTIGEDEYRIVAIDFEHAFGWEHGPDKLVLPQPPALINNLDRNCLEDRLTAIEKITHEQIAQCCADAGYDCAETTEIADILLIRKGLLRKSSGEQGWLG
jgi:hypothetical protein